MNRRDKSQDLLICILRENQKNSKTVYRRKYINDHTHIKHLVEKPKFRISDVKAKQARLSTDEKEQQSSSIIDNETIKNNDCVKIFLVEKNASVDATVEEIIQTTVSRTNAVQLSETGAIKKESLNC